MTNVIAPTTTPDDRALLLEYSQARRHLAYAILGARATFSEIEKAWGHEDDSRPLEEVEACLARALTLLTVSVEEASAMLERQLTGSE